MVALERGTLYGLPVYTNRRVPFGPFDPDLARDIFIRAALVEGDFDTPRAVLRAQPAPGSPISSAWSTSRAGRTSWSTTS